MASARALSAAALALLLAAPAAHAGDPSQVWRTIETAHFQIHYTEPLGDVAHKVAVSAERAHAVLTVALRHEPATQTHIVLIDDSDSSNGFASVLPRNDITLFASAAPDTSVLADHDDWLFDLVLHEYTHIVHLDTISGLPRVVNLLMGKTWAPNQVQPRWVIEGLATYEESKRTSAGRTRHALFDMDLRVATLNGTDLRLDELSNGPRRYPHGDGAYLYGSHFLKYIFDRYGDDKAARMSHDYGGQTIPYGLNRAIKRATGRTFVDLYGDWREFREAKYGLQEEAVARRGRREGRRLTFTGENNLNPHYTRDGRSIVWQRGDGWSPGQFRIIPSGGNAGQSETYAIVERTGQFDMLSDGSMIIEQTRTFRTAYDFQEINRWDRATGHVEQLTFGARASDPAVSPDERQVAFVMNGQTRRRLAVMPLHREAEPRILWTGASRFDQAFSPSWSPDGARVAFSAWREGGRRDILVVDVATGRTVELASDRAQDTEPVWSPDGSYVYFISDRTGIYNVYAWQVATGALWQVTDVLGCALAPTVSPDGRHMTYQGFVGDGYELFEIGLDPERWTPAPPYVDDRPDPVVVRDTDAEVSAPRPYRAIETLAPLRYELSTQLGTLGQSVTVRTDGGDVAGHHGYTLAVTTGLDRTYLNAGGRYSYRRPWAPFGISATRTVTNRGGYQVDGESMRYDEEALRATIGFDMPLMRSPDATSTLAFDYDVDRLRNLDGTLHEEDPNDYLPEEPEDVFLAGVALRWSFSDSRGYGQTVGPQEGREVGLSLRYDHPNLGSDATSLSLNYRAVFYQQIPQLPLHPAVMLRFTGGMRATEQPGADAFSVGGVPDTQLLVQSIIDNARAQGTGYLRGFPLRVATGPQFHLLNAELRQELWTIERGLDTQPFYFRRVHGALLLDTGDAFDGEVDLERFKLSAGAALRLDFTLGFGQSAALETGYARGLTEGGQDEVWLLLVGTL